ncbi:uncharacterized protein LOC103044401 [Astyanax mexicanus]|uniref:uncharacterized protein LOC103044401 n=1 Tax=Astyanax mexicanus TaxID=7994 RepID=UPI0020CAC600|nr:uncharacterized protein LOC103044401 [Astyanax mexicanus]
MLKSGRISTSAELKSQPLLQNLNSKREKPGQKKTKQRGMRSLLGKGRRLYMRLILDGVWSVLPSLPHGYVAARPLGWRRPTSSDVLLLLQCKYDIIKERLYREMLQDEHGVVWWASMPSQEQVNCVCELGEAAEEALKEKDLLYLCDLPGALRFYRNTDEVVLQACGEAVKPRDQAWSSKPKEQAWSAAVFLSELESEYQEERASLTVLLHRVDNSVLREIYLRLCVAVRRAERELHSQTALLASKQYWDKWPYTRGAVSQKLLKFWLQEKQGPTRIFQQDWRAAGCTQQQVALQCLVLCQEQERKSLLEILHTLSLDELQGQSHTLPPAYKAPERSAVSLRQSCVLSLREINESLQGASWPDCAIHLLTQLSLAHEEETWTILRSLPAMDASGVAALLHRYESELHFPKMNNLYELLQPDTSRDRATAYNFTLPDGERTEQRQRNPSESENQAHCSGCGVVLVPEDAPYLEILGTRKHRNEESTERRAGEEEECRVETERETEGAVQMRELGKEEERDGQEKKKREEAVERRDEKRKEKTEGGEEERKVEMFIEKQGSLITLAWSKPTDAVSKEQEMSAALPEEEPAEISTDSHTQISTQQPHGDSINTPNEEQSHTHPENRTSTEHEQALTEHPEDTLTAEEHTHIQAPLDQSHSSMDTECQNSEADEHTTHPTESTEDTVEPQATAPKTHTSEAVGMEAMGKEQESELVCGGQEVCEEKLEEVRVDVCEEQQLQREATMRSLVHIQRRAERRWQRDRDRQLLRVQERLSIIQNRKSDEDMLGLTQEDTFRHLTSTLQQEDEQHQKILVREKLQQLRRERSYILQSRRERNTAGFKELLAPAAQHLANTEDGL